VVGHAADVRRHIGVAAQDATLDGLFTGRQNLVLVGQRSDLGRARLPGAGHGAAGTVRADRCGGPGGEGAFLRATRRGDFDALMQVLDPDVVVRIDAGPRLAATTVLHGAPVVAGQGSRA